MSVQNFANVGFWKTLWSVLTGGAPKLDAARRVEPSIDTRELIALDREVPASSRFGSGSVFGLSARLASTQSINTPILRREGKAAVVPRETKVVQSVKAKPKAVEAIVKKSRPNRHVWLSSRPQTNKSAVIIKFAPRSQRQLKRAA